MCVLCGGQPVMDLKDKNDITGVPADYSDTESGRIMKNPLPVPKRRPHVQMDFDLTDDWDLPRGLEHFDIEISDDDDFDI